MRRSSLSTSERNKALIEHIKAIKVDILSGVNAGYGLILSTENIYWSNELLSFGN